MKLYKKIAEAMKTEIEEVYEYDETTDAGASFKNGYTLQIAEYMQNKYILDKWITPESMESIGAFSTQKDLLNFINAMSV